MSRRRAKHVAGYSICLLVPLMGLSAMLMGSDAGERKPAKDTKTPVCKALKQAVMPVAADGDVDPQGQTASKAKQPSPASEVGECQKQACCKADKPQPLNGTTIAAWRDRIAKAADFDDRLQQRRELMYRCYREGLGYEAHAELEALLFDVLQDQGFQEAHQRAYTEITALAARQWHDATLRAIELVERDYREGSKRDDLQLIKGTAEIETGALANAQATFSMLADVAHSEQIKQEALRKLAFAQTLDCDYDAALITLQRIETAYPNTNSAQYAAMRRGFVLGVAGRQQKAIEAYERFLKNHPGSRYGRVALRHLNQLRSVQVATAP